MKNKKLASLVLIPAVLASLLVGCGNSGQKNQTETSAATQTETTTVAQSAETGQDMEACTLNVWGAIALDKGPGTIIEGFMKKYPQIKVEYTQFTNDDAGTAKLDTALLSGEPIDVFFSYSPSNIVNRVNGGMALNLAEVGGDKFIKENIGTEGVFMVDNQYYALPTAKEPTCIMVNKDAFDAAGIPVPTEWTIDEFREIAQKLNNPEEGMYGVYPLFYADVMPISKTVLGSNAIYNTDGTGANYTAPEYAYDRLSYDLLVTDKSAYPYEEIIAKQVTGQWHRLFVSGDVAMGIFQPWMCRTISNLEEYPHDFKTAFAPFPTPEKGQDTYNLGALNNFMQISSNTKYAQQAWAFLEYWSTDGLEAMLPSGKIPANKNYQNPDMATLILNDPEGTLFDVESFNKIALDPDVKYICDTFTAGANEIKQIQKEETDKLMLGKQTYEEYLTNMQERVDKAIKNAS